MNKSTATLSKKQKMNMKKEEKGRSSNKVPNIIELLDSDSDSESIKIKKKSSSFKEVEKNDRKQYKAELSAQSTNRHNNFNMDRLKKMNPLAKRQKKPTLLEYEVCDGLYEGSQYQGRTLISYKLLGQQSTKYISENHLKGRIQKVIEQIQRLEQLKPLGEHNKESDSKSVEQINNDNPNEKKNQKETRPKNEGGKTLRYFDTVPEKKNDEINLEESEESENAEKIVKCYRCGQAGHMARNCYEEAEKIKCMFCLGQHHHSQCTDKLCFKCAKQGHVSQECRNTGIQCRKCKKVGHIEKNCGAIIMMDYVQYHDKEITDRYGQRDLKKLKCLNSCQDPQGHFNCFQYYKKPPKIYDEDPRG